MATRSEEKSNFKYLTVKHHSIVEESKEPRDGFEPVEVFNPKTKEKMTKYIDKWPGITGYIVSAELYDTGDTYDTRFKGIKLNIDDEVVIDLPEKSSGYDAFAKAGENIDFNKEVYLQAYHNRSKDRTGFGIKQDGERVDWKYTKDNPGDCPPWEQDDDGEWNSSKHRAFLKKRIAEVIIPAIEAATAARRGEDNAPDTVNDVETPEVTAKASAAVAGKGKGKGKPVSDDDIPF